MSNITHGAVGKATTPTINESAHDVLSRSTFFNYSFRLGINFDDILIGIYAKYTFGGGFGFIVPGIWST